MDLVVVAYAAADELPTRVQFSLGSQIRRAAASVPANVAEGNARESSRDYARFLTIAIASLREVQTYVEASRRMGLITEKRSGEMAIIAAETASLLTRLRRSISRG